MLDAGAIAPRQVRVEIARLLAGCERSIAEQAVLLTSEIVTNAVMHGANPLVLDATVDGNVVHVSVYDRDDRLPVRSPGAGPNGGYGLQIVEDLADTWGVEQGQPGKTVWFELAVPPGTTEPASGLRSGART